MSTTRTAESCYCRLPRRAPVLSIAVVVLALFLVALMSVLAIPAQALAAVDVRTFTGANRYQTAVLVSKAGFAPGVEAVVVANGEVYQGALCSAPLAAAYGGPVLLTGSTLLDASTLEEIIRLTPGKIFVVGLGSAVVDALNAAFPDLATAGSIVVIGGADQYEMAKLVSEQVAAKVGPVTGAVLVPGNNFPDAIAVAPLAADKGWPILLTPAAGPLPAMTAQAFAALVPPTILEAGSYVDPGVPTATLTRLVGSDRYATASLIADFAASQGLSYAHTAFVTGDNFPDALSAGPFLALDSGIALLVRQSGVPEATRAQITTHRDEFVAADFIGLSPTARNLVKLLLGPTGVPDGFSFPTLSSGAKGADVMLLEQKLTDLSYRPGPVDGVFDQRTYQAVVAFQKWEWLPRTGTVAMATWERLMIAVRPTPTKTLSGVWIEVDKPRQVLLVCRDGAVERTLPTSTGAAKYWVTPSGSYWIRSENTWERSRYKPLYFNKGYVWAIHGYTSVPTYPASHGCVRIPIWDMDELHAMIPVGTKVFIY
jgi:putative cell wall-binding protein